MSGLHVRTMGEGRDLVLLHGWGFHSGAWEDVAPALARRYRVHLVDLPGHGGSAECHVEAFDDAAAEVARCIPEGSIVVGWSLGGLLAQRIAGSGHRLGALALVSSTPCFVQRPDWPSAMHAATLDRFASGLELERERTLLQFVRLNALNAPAAREVVRSMMQRLERAPAPTPAGLQRALRWLREVDLRDGAARIEVPCIVIHGTRDAITPVAAGRWLGERIRGARLCEIEDAAHLPFASHAERFVQALEAFA